MSEQLQGRELDAALTKALGWQVEWRDVYHLRAHHEYMVDIAGIDVKDLEHQPVQLGIDPQVIPFFSTDLNAMHECEEELQQRKLGYEYARELERMVADDGFDLLHATAEQRARAALAVLTK